MLHRLLLVEVANDKIVAMLTAVALLATTRSVVRGKHRRVLGAGAAVAVVLAVADTVNTYYGYLPQLADVLGVVEWHTVSLQQVLRVQTSGATAVGYRDPRAGAVLSLPVTGAVSGFGRHTVLAALPPQYFTEPGRRFPVVYLLHGSPGRPQDWLRANRLLTITHRATAAAPMIFVMPPMSRGWLDDSECVNGEHEHIETWLVEDVVPAVDSVLRTIPDRGHRAVAGMSAGGYCALNLAVRDSNVFSAALDMSGYTEPTYGSGLRHLFGPHWQALAAANTPSSYLDAHHLTLPLRIRFDVGRGDARPLRQIGQLVPRLTAAQVDASVSIRGGGHTYHVWVPALRDGLSWFATVLGGAPGATDGCPPPHRSDVGHSGQLATPAALTSGRRGTAPCVG